MISCPICGGVMKLGIALNCSEEEGALYIFGKAPGNAETIGFIDVLKCEDCGRSLKQEELIKYT